MVQATVKLGILVRDLGPSQLNYFLIKNANAALDAGLVRDVVVFYETLARPCVAPRFACMQVAEGWGFDGQVVATTLSTASKLLRFPGPVTKSLYVWDLEWLRGGIHRYRDLKSVYGHPELRLLARSDEHRRVIADCWGKTPDVVGDFSFEDLLK